MERKSNIELLRIVAMLLVVCVHANYFSLGKVEFQDIAKAPFDSFCQVLAEQLCIICVNVFILISGWFGIKPNIKGALSLLFQVFFFHTLIIAGLFLAGESVSLRAIVDVFYFGYPYWFIASYLVLYAISPILNAFVENATPRLFFSVLIAFFFGEFVFGWTTNAVAFQQGYSTLSFVGLYLLAQFIRKYCCKMQNISVCKNILLYLFFTFVPVIIFCLTGLRFRMFSYSAPFVIAASAFFFLAFNKMKISSSVINYMAYSSLSIYLVHMHPLIINHFTNLMNYAYMNLGGYWYALFVIIFSVCFGSVCILLDKLRICLWRFLSKKIVDRLICRFTSSMEKLYSILGL